MDGIKVVVEANAFDTDELSPEDVRLATKKLIADRQAGKVTSPYNQRQDKEITL